MAALAAIAAAQQAAIGLCLDDGAGPSNSTAGQAASAAPDGVQTFLTLFGKKQDCKAAEQAIQQEMEVSVDCSALAGVY